MTDGTLVASQINVTAAGFLTADRPHPAGARLTTAASADLGGTIG